MKITIIDGKAYATIDNDSDMQFVIARSASPEKVRKQQKQQAPQVPHPCTHEGCDKIVAGNRGQAIHNRKTHKV